MTKQIAVLATLCAVGWFAGCDTPSNVEECEEAPLGPCDEIVSCCDSILAADPQGASPAGELCLTDQLDALAGTENSTRTMPCAKPWPSRPRIRRRAFPAPRTKIAPRSHPPRHEPFPPRKKTYFAGCHRQDRCVQDSDLVRKLIAAGLEVQVVMTDSAQRFVTPLALEVVSGKPVATSLWDQRQSASGSDIPHTEMGRHVDGILIAPATADFLGRTATGLAGDLLGNILLASSCPVLLCPSMNDQMWANPLVQANLNRLLEQPRFKRMEPDTGELACKVVGKGRMPDPERIVENVLQMLAPGPLSGKRFLVTAGPTREYLDPARFLSNPSTGRMGYAIARELLAKGGEVVCIHGPTALVPPSEAQCIPVVSAEEMAREVKTHPPVGGCTGDERRSGGLDTGASAG